MADVEVRAVGGGGRFEQLGSYVRARRVGPFVFVAGTTAVEPSGRVHAPGDMAAQTALVFRRISDALEGVGASLGDVVRTMAYLTDLGAANDYVRVHGEVFAGIEPVATAVQAGLATPGLVVEVEVEAIIAAELRN